jgi:hypothetical protein
MDTLAFGWLLVRVSKGARLTISQTRVNGEAWFPSHVFAPTARARIGLIKLIVGENEYSYSNYRKLRAGSRPAVGVPGRDSAASVHLCLELFVAHQIFHSQLP